MKTYFLVSIFLILVSVSLAAIGQLCLKVGMNQVGVLGENLLKQPFVIILKVITNYQILVGLLLYALSAFSWLIVLSRVDLSFAYPFVGLSYVIVVLLAFLFLKEPLNLYRVAGSIIILVGLIIIARGY